MEVVAAIGGRIPSCVSSSIQSSSSTTAGRRPGSFSSSSSSAPSCKLIHHRPYHHHQHCHLSSSQPFSHLFSTYQLSSSYNATRTHHKTRIFIPHLVASLEQTEATYILIKPDGVQRGLVGEIISRFENKGFKLTGLKLYQCPKVLAMEHYKDLSSKPFFPKLIEYITSGPVVCMAWEGIGVVASARKLIGATNPLLAEPGTIRGDLAVQTGRNVVHGSDSPENGQREIALWFKEGELCDWTPVQAPWLTE